MRKSHRLVATIIAIVAALSLTAVGQEEPLPRVTPKAIVAETQANADALFTLSVDLPAEPFVPNVQPTLLSAAEANDFATFDALYRAERTPAFADLHVLWTYAVTDPIGAFYGADMHARLSRTYPNFAAYIADHRIVDSNGVPFYPTAETRAFLLRYVTSGAPARFALATPPAEPRIAGAGAVSPPSVGAGGSPAQRRRAGGAHTEAKPTVRVEAPAPAAPAPVVVAEAPPVVVAEPQPVQQPPAPAPTVTADSFTGRGILLLIVGILGIGVLTMMMRTPKEEEAHDDAVPSANVEPLRRPQEKVDAPRATGSHG